ncbi:MAG: nuclear transport factor 2 family protein [Cyclobacteriaceae bacterium]|nr:nuclear transport factor 2 family protein [Cyclobacteriaceae bacterium]
MSVNNDLVKKFKDYFTQMKLEDDNILKEIYSENVIFIDPIHRINGLDSLITYFKKLNRNLIEGSFQFTHESAIDNIAYLQWEMNLQLKRPKKNVKATGISVLYFDEKIIMQRDFFDAGEIFYENIPVMGSIIRFIKSKISG